MLVTIYTDASRIPDTEATAYAFWIRSDTHRITRARICPASVDGVCEAELYAIYQAVGCVLKWHEAVDCYIINSDSKEALYRLERHKGKTEVQTRLVKATLGLIGESRVILRHVKAHTGRNDVRSWLNRWCDQQAKQIARSIKNG